MTAPFTVVAVELRLEQGGELRTVEFAAATDRITSQDGARAIGRKIGEALADNLALRLQHGEALS